MGAKMDKDGQLKETVNPLQEVAQDGKARQSLVVRAMASTVAGLQDGMDSNNRQILAKIWTLTILVGAITFGMVCAGAYVVRDTIMDHTHSKDAAPMLDRASGLPVGTMRMLAPSEIGALASGEEKLTSVTKIAYETTEDETAVERVREVTGVDRFRCESATEEELCVAVFTSSDVIMWTPEFFKAVPLADYSMDLFNPEAGELSSLLDDIEDADFAAAGEELESQTGRKLLNEHTMQEKQQELLFILKNGAMPVDNCYTAPDSMTVPESVMAFDGGALTKGQACVASAISRSGQRCDWHSGAAPQGCIKKAAQPDANGQHPPWKFAEAAACVAGDEGECRLPGRTVGCSKSTDGRSCVTKTVCDGNKENCFCDWHISLGRRACSSYRSNAARVRCYGYTSFESNRFRTGTCKERSFRASSKKDSDYSDTKKKNGGPGNGSGSGKKL